MQQTRPHHSQHLRLYPHKLPAVSGLRLRDSRLHSRVLGCLCSSHAVPQLLGLYLGIGELLLQLLYHGLAARQLAAEGGSLLLVPGQLCGKVCGQGLKVCCQG